MNELNFDESTETFEHNESADTIIGQATRQDDLIGLTQNTDFHNKTLSGHELESRHYRQRKNSGKRNKINHEVYIPNNVEEF